jgi:FAD/FMN-containing dehydrogenase
MSDFLAQLKSITGDKNVITDSHALKPFITEYRGRYVGDALCAVKPGNTDEVSQIVRLCAANNIVVVPQGGNTGLVGGSIPYDKKSIVLNLSRMNKIRAIDAENFSMVVEAGCVLSVVQQAAIDAKRYFPLSLASEGSSQIGGNIGANAGGILTIRYGNTRDLVLGLEVILPSGEIWNGLRSLRKDNTGYDLKQLFIGSEGTLGVITAAVLKLFPDPGLRETFFIAIDSPEKAITLLSDIKAAFGDNLLAYELIARRGVEFAVAYNPQVAEPLRTKSDWHVLVEIAAGKNNTGLRTRVEDVLEAALQKNLILDATIAQNDSQRQMFWILRESVSDAQRYAGASIKHDISVPVFKIPDFIREATILVEKMIPGVRPVIFGHAGDGNLHFNLTQPEGADKEAFMARWDEINHAVHDIVQKYDGSIAAEHGVGVFKAAEMAQRKAPVELELMKKIKHAFDPQNIMNPGKVLL